MTKGMSFLEDKLLPIAGRLGANKYLKAISNGFVSVMAATIVGSMFTLLGNLPITAYTEWLASSGFGAILALPSQATIDLIALYVSFFVAYNLAREFNVDGAGAGLASLVSFFLVTGRVEGSISVAYLGAKGLFTAMFVALVAGRIFSAIVKRGWVIKLPDSVPPNVASSFSALIPAAVVVTLFLALAGVMTLTPYGNLHVMVFTVLQQSLMNFLGNNIFSFVLFQLFTNILWFFGLHGGNIVGSITNPIYMPLALENFAAFQAGLPLPNIISSALGKTFISGGVGSMFALAILMVSFSKSKQFKTLGKLSLPTTLFFINEPLMFGIPVVLNPLFFIPLLLVTPILAVLTYAVMSAGIVPPPNGAQIPWTTPPIIYGILQGSWKIALWEFVTIVLAGAMWFPFFKIADRQALEEELALENSENVVETIQEVKVS